jgi:glycosyltransferase involved in cell wall biosynthesis
MEQRQPLITILTPTYNRAHTLPRLAASLEAQAFRDFEWLVVDDGSTDDTTSILEDLVKSAAFPIRVIRTPNGGKHRALNRGIPEACGDWVYIVDSDDYLPVGALAAIAQAIPMAAAHVGCCGIIGLRGDTKGGCIGSRLPAEPRFQTIIEISFRRGVTGDKALVFRSDCLSRFPFPEFEGERFLTEAVVWHRMADEGLSLLVVDEILYECEYQEAGLSDRSLELRVKNPQGNLLYYEEQLALGMPLFQRIRPAINYMRFALLSGIEPGKAAKALAKGRFLSLLALPVAGLMALRDRAILRSTS